MKRFLQTAGVLAADMASTLVFALVVALTQKTFPAVLLAVAIGVAQIGAALYRGKPVKPLEWLSLVLVVLSGGVTLVTNDPRYVLFKPSLIYVVIGLFMLRRGWMIPYLPPIARAVVPDVAVTIGYGWAVLMFVSAVLNAALASGSGLSTWAVVMPSFAIASKAVLFTGGFLVLRLMARRRLAAMPEEERARLISLDAAPHGGAVA
ncbi:septation protein IspZ [Oryzifoliimicrobium ureilyticus]|uniref:septation protein IspZ n=1 Tax=Oryzifoliimicrobium ureilyticus TaxID=3113724 RepID=UPI003076311D